MIRPPLPNGRFMNYIPNNYILITSLDLVNVFNLIFLIELLNFAYLLALRFCRINWLLIVHIAHFIKPYLDPVHLYTGSR